MSKIFIADKKTLDIVNNTTCKTNAVTNSVKEDTNNILNSIKCSSGSYNPLNYKTFTMAYKQAPRKLGLNNILTLEGEGYLSNFIYNRNGVTSYGTLTITVDDNIIYKQVNSVGKECIGIVKASDICSLPMYDKVKAFVLDQPIDTSFSDLPYDSTKDNNSSGITVITNDLYFKKSLKIELDRKNIDYNFYWAFQGGIKG